jgi:hypothetical protein
MSELEFASIEEDDFFTVRLIIRKGVLARVLSDCIRNPTAEIGGRWFGYYVAHDDDEQRSKLPDEISELEGDLHVIIDYIPTGPNPDSVTEVELQPDRKYQMWAFERLKSLDSEIEVLGSWHSHVPNGLERFSGIDHRSYHSKLSKYPFPRMVCSLIHQMPENIEDARNHLHHAWYERGAPLGEHHFEDEADIVWFEDELPAPDVIDLEDFTLYRKETGGQDETEEDLGWSPTTDEWLEFIHSLDCAGGVEPEVIKIPNSHDWGLILSSHPHDLSVLFEDEDSAVVSWVKNGESIVEEMFQGVNVALVRLSELCEKAGIKTIPLHIVHPHTVRTFLDSKQKPRPWWKRILGIKWKRIRSIK